jgi:hypothetical protein
VSRHDENELSHDPVPGYKPVFFIVVLVAALYLAAVFLLGGHA